jgi:hypothetical protein
MELANTLSSLGSDAADLVAWFEDVSRPLPDKPGVKPIIEKALGANRRKMIFTRRGKTPTRLVKTIGRERISYVLSAEAEQQ